MNELPAIPTGQDKKMTIIEERIIDRPIEADPIEQLNTADEAWRVYAACQAVPDAPELFFSEELQDIAEAKRICVECPVIAECLEGAVARAEPCGVWGGQLFLNGKILTVKRRRGRPPKHPRPEDQLPLIPVPERFQKLIA
ncbi:MAG: WhiB family transcriptional regulator [Actinomycetota bacterium]